MPPTEAPFNVSLSNGHSIPARFVDEAGMAWWIGQLTGRPGLTTTKIGASREGRQLHGLKVGNGPVRISITAGAHADEPAGPIAACVLAWFMSAEECAPLRDRFTFTICPQVNPDGAEANRPWFSQLPDLETYLRNVKREEPGDDIEFGYPTNGFGPLRPENAAVAEFLATGAPYHVHASLHSMGMAEGAWFLIEKSWVDKTQPLQQRLCELAKRHGFALHDIQRNGEKGFTRIGPGLCTTPTGAAMREHFAKAPLTAAKFHGSSMEYVRQLGGNPLALVSEVPNFAISGSETTDPSAVSDNATYGNFSPTRSQNPAAGETLYEILRDRVKRHVAMGNFEDAIAEASKAGVVPVPFAKHVALQVEMVLAACEFIVASDIPASAQAALSDKTQVKPTN